MNPEWAVTLRRVEFPRRLENINAILTSMPLFLQVLWLSFLSDFVLTSLKVLWKNASVLKNLYVFFTRRQINLGKHEECQ